LKKENGTPLKKEKKRPAAIDIAKANNYQEGVSSFTVATLFSLIHPMSSSPFRPQILSLTSLTYTLFWKILTSNKRISLRSIVLPLKSVVWNLTKKAQVK
jgi:hypothetical protein